MWRELASVSDSAEISPGITKREIFAHLAGWEALVFEALHEQFRREGAEFSWRDWPAAMRDPNSATVAEFARANADRVEFFQFLQWEADRQLGDAAAAFNTK